MKRLSALLILFFFASVSVVSAFSPLLAQAKSQHGCCCQTQRESAPDDMLGLQLKNKPCGCEISKTSDAPQAPVLTPTPPLSNSFEIFTAAAVPTGVLSLHSQNVLPELFAKQKIPAPAVPVYLAHCVLLI